MPKRMSDLDAFLALEDIEDEEIKMPLKEGKGFNVRDEKDMDKAEEFVNQDNKKEVSLEVIDVDADSLEHLKNNEEYVGQMILQCNSCKANRFINAEDLVQSEGDEDTYNIEDECPHCHGKGNGFHLIGQVGKVESEEEPKFENDSLTDEPKFDNEAEEQPAEEEAKEEAALAEPEESDEEDFAEDDTADMESTLGNEFDSDDVEYDDTEEKPEEPKEDSLTNDEETEYDEPLDHAEEPEEEDKKKEESLEEEIDTNDQTLYEFFESIIEPENIESVLVFDLDKDNNEEEIYNGSYDEIPQQLFDAEYIGFDVAQGTLIVNIDSDSEIDELTPTVKNVLDKFLDEFNDKISVWDQVTGEEVFSGTKQSVIEEFGHNAFLSFEAPERLQIKVRDVTLNDSLHTPYKEELDFANPTDKLISNIIKENKLREYNVSKFGSEEYWIADSIKTNEDLKHIYENYVVNKSSNLINEFKDVTGYRDNLDVLYEETLNESSEDNEEETVNEVKEKLKNNSELTAIVYGYESRGKFHTLQNGELYEITNDRELQMATELVRAKYHPTGSVKVFYRDGLEEAKEAFEADFRNRKDLSEAILKCEAEGVGYKIRKSLKEGYRYTLLKESPTLGFFNAPAEVEEEPAQEQPTAVIDPRDAELVNKLTRIAHDISEAIRNSYGVEVNEAAILADLIQDLQIISGQISPEQLANTPINNLTREMYNAYNGFYEALDELTSFVTGQPIRTTQAQKIQQALDSLDDERFSTETLQQGVRDESFLLALQQGQIPGITYNGNPQDIQLLAAPEENEEGEAIGTEGTEGDEDEFDESLNESAQEYKVLFHAEGLDHGWFKKEFPTLRLEDSDKWYLKWVVGPKADVEKFAEAINDDLANVYAKGIPEYWKIKEEKGWEEAARWLRKQEETYPDIAGDILIPEDISLNESVDIHIEGNDVTIKDDSGEDVAIIPVEPEGEEAPEETEEEQPEENNEEEIELELEEPTEEEQKESLQEKLHIDPEQVLAFNVGNKQGLYIDPVSLKLKNKEGGEIDKEQLKQDFKDFFGEEKPEEITFEFEESLDEAKKPFTVEFYDLDGNYQSSRKANSKEEAIELGKTVAKEAKDKAGLGQDPNICSYIVLDLDGKEVYNSYDEETDESLIEAKKDDELPADPDVVKTNVHATLNNLVTDEIEAINGYEEAKAEIADTHIEHKDDIIDVIDHIEDEEEEHIDELIDAASEIPFEKDGESKETVEQEPIQDVEQEPEEEFELEEPTMESLNESNDGWRELPTFEDVAEFGKGSKWSVCPDFDPNAKYYFDRYTKDGNVFVGKGEGDNRVLALKKPDGTIFNAYDINDRNVSIDESAFESFINEWFDKNSEETKVFEALSGSIDDNGTIILEGKLLKEDNQEEKVSFTLTPNKEMNEDLMDSKKVTSYTITSTSLPEGLVLKESYLWFHGSIRFKTKEEAQNFVDEFMKPQEECIEPSREIRHIDQIIPNKENQSDFDKEYPYIVSYFTGDIRDDKSEEATKLVRHFWSEFDKRESK